MKLNWGYRVAILYIGFACFITYFITRSMQQKIDLVVPDYYEQELNYQQKLESMNRNNNLTSPLSISTGTDEVIINFPQEFRGQNIQGNILLFRPSDNNNDLIFPVQAGNDGVQRISTAGLKGMYRVKVEFESAGNQYYSEQQVILN